MKNIALKSLGLMAMLILLLIPILLAMTYSDLVNPSNIVIFSFVRVLYDYPFVIPACLIFLPSLLWKQSMFLVYSLTLGLVLIVPLAQVLYLRYSGQDVDNLGEALALFIFLVLGVSYIVGMIVRAFFRSMKRNSTKNTPSEFSFKISDIIERTSRD